MITEFNITTTGLVPTTKLEGLGSYHDHPTTNLDLLTRFTLDDIINDTCIQLAIDGGEITVQDEDGNSITQLQYLVNSIPVFDTDIVSNNKTYIGYGNINACKIQEVTTINSFSGTSYTSLWANGNESFDKIWANRVSYTYF